MKNKTLLLTLCTALLLAIACSDDYALSGTEDDAAGSSVASGRLRVVPDDIESGTRLAYATNTTTFTDGDIVGSVICKLTTTTTTGEDGSTTTTTDTTYVATAKWVFDETYNTFMVQRYWTTQAMAESYGTWPSTSSAKTRADDDETTSSDESTATTLYAFEPVKGDATNFIIGYELSDSTLASASSDRSVLAGGYTTINSKVTEDEPLVFFFYYPYIDPLETAWKTTSTGNSITNSASETDIVDNWPAVLATDDSSEPYLGGFAGLEHGCTFSSTVYSYDTINVKSSTTTGALNEKVTCYDWRNYPYFVNLDQDATTPYGMRVSDMLHVKYLAGVHATTATTMRLSFSKLSSTIRVLSTTNIVNARIMAQQTAGDAVTDDNVTYYPIGYNNPVTVGMKVDLASGYLTDFTSGDDDLTQQYNYRQITSTDHTLKGRNYTYTPTYTAPDDFTNAPTSAVRIHIPPQDAFAGLLAFQYQKDFINVTGYGGWTTDGSDSIYTKAQFFEQNASSVTWNYLDLTGLGGTDQTLESNTRYTVNAFKEDDSYIYFTRSYSASSTYIGGNTKNCAYLTIAREDSNVSVGVSQLKFNSISYSVTLPYPEGSSTTCSYYCNLRNTQGDYLGIYVPTTMKLTMYFAASSQYSYSTTTYTDPTTVLIYQTDASTLATSTDFYASPTIEEVGSSEDKSTHYLKTEVYLTEGWYRVRRSGGNTWLLMAVVSME